MQNPFSEMTFLENVKLTVIFIYEVIRGYLLAILHRFKRPKSMAGKTVVITGGASGIGKEVAQMFSNLGAKIALLDINEVNFIA